MTSRTPFAGLQVLEISAGISASYCAKMFVDAGADVVKLEPAAGDPTRWWSAVGVVPDAGQTGALFGYLNAGKRSVRVADGGDIDAGAGALGLLAAADVVVTDGSDGWTPVRIAAVVGERSPAVVVSITPFGLHGPYVDEGLAVNEFVLQAMCGSTGGRGWPGEMPLQAGGRIGEWVAGTFAAVAAAAALRRSRLTGLGDLIDVSMLESMVITMGGLTAVAASVLGDARPLAGRSVEMPSITATADGLVGFCTVTAQQFQDFLVMIDRADLLEDANLASFAGRAARREEFLAIVDAWAATRTTAEIVDFASAMRIPVAPIGSPNTVTEIDHFRERGVFVKNHAGQLQPRTPYRSDAFDTVTPGEVPALGEHDAAVGWAPRSRAGDVRPDAAGARPLADLRVVDLTAFWAGPIATQLLGALGADVIKVEGVRRPDGMRFASGRPPSTDQWWETGSVFLSSNNDKRDLSLELSLPEAQAVLLELIATADLVIENFSPRVMGNLGLDEATIQQANQKVVTVRMPAFGLDGPWRDRVGFAQTMEQASGMAWMTGRRDGPPQIPRGVCDPIAGLHAAFAALAGLEVRAATGSGMQIESTMVEAALNVAAEALLDGATQTEEPRRDGNRGPGASPQGVYRCAGDDEWVALAVLDDAQWPALAALVDPAGSLGAGLGREADRRARADEIDAVISTWSAGIDVHDATARLRAAGAAAARVLPPAELLVDPQLLERGFWERVEHPVAGRFLTTGQPFRFASVTTGWVRRPAPLFGQHNLEILGDVLGKNAAQIQELLDGHAVSGRPAGL